MQQQQAAGQMFDVFKVLLRLRFERSTRRYTSYGAAVTS